MGIFKKYARCFWRRSNSFISTIFDRHGSIIYMQSILKFLGGKLEKHYSLYTGITAGLFLLQVVHLYWLTMHVVAYRLWGVSFFNPDTFWQWVIILVDYTEIPAIIATSVLYIHSINKNFNKKDLLLLILLNTQWLHIFWISDEFVLKVLHEGVPTVLPFWLAWAAIMVDYLELPVMYDTTKKFILSLNKNKWK